MDNLSHNISNNIINKTPDTLPSVCIIILNWNTANDTIECIESLKNVRYPNLDIVIVENGSKDDSYDHLLKYDINLSIIRLNDNRGYAGGNNVGIKYAVKNNYKYILVLNNDTIVQPDFLVPLIDTVENNSQIGLVTGKVLHYENPNRIYGACGKFSRIFCSGINGNSNELIGPNNTYRYGFSKVTFISGTMMLIPSKIINEFGMFDEKYFLYFEDLEFSRRISNKYLLAYVPSSVIHHKSGGGTKWTNYTLTYLYYHTRNRIWVFKDEHILYRTYVIIFSLLIAVTKTFVIILGRNSLKQFPTKHVKAIWNGIKDGIIS